MDSFSHLVYFEEFLALISRRTHVRSRRKTKAKENLNKAIEILKECGADGWVEKYEKELSDL